MIYIDWCDGISSSQLDVEYSFLHDLFTFGSTWIKRAIQLGLHLHILLRFRFLKKEQTPMKWSYKNSDEYSCGMTPRRG